MIEGVDRAAEALHFEEVQAEEGAATADLVNTIQLAQAALHIHRAEERNAAHSRMDREDEAAIGEALLLPSDLKTGRERTRDIT
jgi:hypothetical protein